MTYIIIHYVYIDLVLFLTLFSICTLFLCGFVFRSFNFQVSFGALSDVMVILRMRQSIVIIGVSNS